MRKRKTKKRTRRPKQRDLGKSDPWSEIKGILSHEEAEKMRRLIDTSRHSRAEAPNIDERSLRF
jgi:hypothetical protein